jgi:hypothetical protein
MRIFRLSIILSLLLHCCTDNREFYTYLDSNYSVDYPVAWQVTHETDGLKLSPDESYGVVTIAYYPSTDRSLESMKEFILGLSKVKNNSQNIRMTKLQNATEYYYEYADTYSKKIIKVIRKDNDFYLLQLKCQLNKWDTKKQVFLHITESFHFRTDR